MVRFFAAASLVKPGVAIPGHLAAGVKLESILLRERLDDVSRGRLAGLLEAHPAVDLARWSRGVELTAARAGHLLAGDLALAKRLLAPRLERARASASRDDLSDLPGFALSTSFAKLRGSVGWSADPTLALRSAHPEIVGATLDVMHFTSQVPAAVVPLLESLLVDGRVVEHFGYSNVSYEPLMAKAARALSHAGARAIPILERASTSAHEVAIPIACHDQGRYIGNYGTERVHLAQVAADALHSLQRRLLESQRQASPVEAAPAAVQPAKSAAARASAAEPTPAEPSPADPVPADPVARTAALRAIVLAANTVRSQEELARAMSTLPPGAGIEADGESGSSCVLRFVPPVRALELAHLLAWEAPVAETRDRLQQRWEIYLLERARPPHEARLPSLAACSARAALVRRPMGASLEAHPGPPGGTRRLGVSDEVLSLRLEYVGGEPAAPVEEREALERRIRAMPQDRRARGAYERLLLARGLEQEAAYVRDLAAFEYALSVGASRPDFDARLTQLARQVQALDPSFVAVAASGYARHGASLAFAPMNLAVRPEAVSGGSGLRWTFDDQMRHHVLVVDDFLGRAHDRPVEDRRSETITRESFGARLGAARLRFGLELDGRKLEVAIDTAADFEPERLREKLLALGVAEPALGSLLDALTSDAHYLGAERAWRSLWWLLQYAGERVVISMLNCSKSDLLEDFEDAGPTLARSGLHKTVLPRNHQGMAPFGLVVFGYELDPASAADAGLASSIAKVASAAAAPAIVSLAPEAWAPKRDQHASYRELRTTDDAHYLGVAAPRFELHRGARGATFGVGSYLVGALVLQSFGRHAVGCPLVGSVGPVSLSAALDLETSRDDGYLVFRATDAGPMLATDVTSNRYAQPVEASLASSLLVSRLAQHVLDIDLRANAVHVGGDLDAMKLRFDERLAARFASVAGLRVVVEGLAWRDSGRLSLTLDITAPSAVSAAGTRLRRAALLRTDG